MTSSRTSSIMAVKNQNGRLSKVFHLSFSNLLCMLIMTSYQTSSITAGKKINVADLLRFHAFYINILTLWHDNFKSF